MQYIVVRIHNQSLGKVVEVSTIEEGMDVVREWFEEQFNRVMNEEEIDNLEVMMEVHNDEDHDNHYTFSIGIVE